MLSLGVLDTTFQINRLYSIKWKDNCELKTENDVQ